MSDKYGCATTRFTNDTWEQNCAWRKKHNQACIYNSTSPMAASLSELPYIYVIEMNNDNNSIEGVGLVVNNNCCEKVFKVYSDPLYNLFTYKSNCRMDISDFTEPHEIQKINDVLIKILFKGYSHLKRGSGFTKVPDSIVFKTSIKGKRQPNQTIKENWVQFFNKAFRRHFGNKLTI
tara:strand:- start:251 stop:781 length:531 start_codon:yes stop_codon:yes gene_type:complete